MAPYLTLEEFKLRTRVPRPTVDLVEARDPGWIETQLDEAADFIDARLRKRYAAPFSTPYPKAVLRWLALIVSAAVYDKRGTEALDEQAQRYYDGEKEAKAEIAEAANAVDGLFELPLRANTSESGVSKGEPLGYSEQSPYVAFDLQAETGYAEDRAGRGSGG